MVDYGLKVSKIGSDVNTAADTDLVYSSKFNGWKIVKSAHDDGAGVSVAALTTSTLAHGVSGYVPAVKVFSSYTDLEGNAGFYNATGSRNPFEYWADGTNISLRNRSASSATAYYFVFVDPTESAAGSQSSQQDYGLKIAREGFDVSTADDTELSLTSRYKTFKESSNGTATLSLSLTSLSANINATTTTIPVNSVSGFPASGIIWIETIFPSANEIVKYTGISGSSFTGCTRGYMGSTAATHTSGQGVNEFYGKVSVSHSLGYPPSFSVFLNFVGATTVNRETPTFVAGLLSSYAESFCDNNTLEIRVENYTPQGPGWSTLSGSFSFRYYIFLDQIT